MCESARHIEGLLHLYAELMDDGRFADAAELFTDAQIQRSGPDGPEITPGTGLLEYWTARVPLHEDGTPRTKHVISNVVVDVDEAAGTASSRCYYTILRPDPQGGVRIASSGRYHDRFTRDGQQWRWAFRDYGLRDSLWT